MLEGKADEKQINTLEWNVNQYSKNDGGTNTTNGWLMVNMDSQLPGGQSSANKMNTYEEKIDINSINSNLNRIGDDGLPVNGVRFDYNIPLGKIIKAT